ncbi:MAG: 23S rRNA (uracil(1939)-C(5))-methyltransferase RlmD [Thermodesulfobacteriota bacterium]|nr:MAG: 23S rRNA (uracil(1939)-C(5))-methyltransferase RlmD [Thermodesulfobacteriota bacterium]
MNANVKITGLAYGGRGVGRIDGRVVFVPYTAPGDEADVEIKRVKKNFSDGVLKCLHKPSEIRTEPACPVFGDCGGCALQHIRYSDQVLWKENIFLETLKRIGGLELPQLDPPVPSQKDFYYRSKARFQIHGNIWGFFRAGTNRVVDIESCAIADPLINSAFTQIRGIFKERFTSSRTLKSLQSLEIGVSSLDGRAIASFGLRGVERGFPWKIFLKEIEELKGVEALITRPGARARVFTGGDLNLCYEAGGVKFHVPVGVFSQVNRPQNEALIKTLIGWCGLRGGERVLELFSGAGNFSLPLAMAGAEVLGVEASREAVRAARGNAARNNIGPVEFIQAGASVWLKENVKGLEKFSPHVVVLDPPRGGDIDVAKVLAESGPEKIVYLSCSPPTMARDLSVLAAGGYGISRACVFDLFPQTGHIEGMVLLERGGNEINRG